MYIRKLLMQFFFLLFTFAVYAQNVDKTKDIGEISYSSSSTPTGAFTYDVPIDVYPGKNGTQPSLSLSYNSQNLNLFSVLGVGWSIGGLSEISRSQTNQYYDNITTSSPIKEGLNVFTLDGLRLVDSNDVNYTYQTEEGNIYIKVKDNYTKFEVYYPNGVIAYYGLGTHKYSYPITKLVDPLGNYIDYTYSNENNRFYIDQISYSSNENVEIGKVKFVYKINDFEKFVYIDGIQIKTTKRISEINCYFGSLIQRAYSIDYKKSGNNYFLEKVNYSSSGKSLNPLTFEYGNGLKPSIQKSETPYTTNVEPGAGPKTVIPVKWESETSTDGYFIFPSNPTEYANMYIYSSYAAIRDNERIEMPTTESFLVGDVNGDLNQEVVQVNFEYGNKKNIWIRTIEKNTFGKNTNNVNQFLMKNFPENRTYLLGDFTGRGKDDLLMIAYGKDLGGKDRNTTAYFFDLENKLKVGSSLNYIKILPQDRLLLIDFDGDGAVELLHINSANANIYKIDLSGNYTRMASLPIKLSDFDSFKSDIFIGDLNNDGKTDIIISPTMSVVEFGFIHSGTCQNAHQYHYSSPQLMQNDIDKGKIELPILLGSPDQMRTCNIIGIGNTYKKDGGSKWTVYLSNGKDKFESKTFECSRNMYKYNGADQFTLVDINGDNYLDLVRVSQYDNQITVYYNEGGFFTSNPINLGTPPNDGFLITTNGSASYGNEGKGFAIVQNDERKLTMYADKNQDKNILLMTKAISSYGNVTKLDYSKIDDHSVYYGYSEKQTYPWTSIPYGLDLLSSRKDSINNLKINDLYFIYTKGVVHLQGLGFKGFEKVELRDHIDGTRSTTQEFDPKNWSV